jgi:hypothetical protein
MFILFLNVNLTVNVFFLHSIYDHKVLIRIKNQVLTCAIIEGVRRANVPDL